MVKKLSLCAKLRNVCVGLCPLDVPEKVLSKVDHVISVATEGKTTLFKASELLEFTMEPFQYARRSAQDNFDLSRKSSEALRSYDSSFTDMMKARLTADMTCATSCEEDCLQHLGKKEVFESHGVIVHNVVDPGLGVPL